MKSKLAGCVILYNPDAEVLENIASYIEPLDCLYVVDNMNGRAIIDALQKRYANKIIPITHSENMGIAYSLNEVLNLVNRKYDFLLTMDQDSRFYKNSMKVYESGIAKFNWSEVLGIGSMIVEYGFEVPCQQTKVEWGGTERLITSGNIISVPNAIKIGGFNEELFIDEVDYDFCYKGKASGLKMYVAKSGVYLLHSLGNTFKKKVLVHTFEIMNHNKIRKYYIFRNRLYIAQKYHSIIGLADTWRYYLKANLRLIFDVIFFENDKVNKLKYISLGLFDFLRNNYGKRF